MGEKGRREESTGGREAVPVPDPVQDPVPDPVPVRGSSRAHRRARSTPPKGKFTKNAVQCTWVSRTEGDVVRLHVSCRNTAEGSVKVCEYVGKPETCRDYRANAAGFWKQVARALKKMHGKLCEDTGALVKAGMCKRAPKDAHFKLGPWASQAVHPSRTPPRPRSSTSTSTSAPTSTRSVTSTTTKGDPFRLEPVESTPADGQKCPERVDKQKLAEEYCNSAWSSVCSFFFSMLDSTEC